MRKDAYMHILISSNFHFLFSKTSYDFTDGSIILLLIFLILFGSNLYFY